jgi:hypothetical protein
MLTKDKEYSVDTELKKRNLTKSSSTDIIIAPSNEGRMTPVKNAMLEIISGADPSLSPQDTHVRGDWKILTTYLEDNYPVVTLRLGTVDVMERIYGRQMNKTQRGHYVAYSFSAHVWAEKSYQLFDEGADEHQTQARLASELADAIIDTLEKFNGDETSGVCWFHKVTARESEPERGPQRLTRVIIEGFVIAKRPLS